MRNPVFDIMKFVAIMAMIVGHCVHDWRRPLIYIWHMPLFFIVSGYFFKPQPIFSGIKRHSQRLLIPYLISAVILLAFTAIGFTTINHDTIGDMSIVLLTGSINPIAWGTGYPIWFLMALFICSCAYTTLHATIKSNIYITIVIVAISVITHIYATTCNNYAPFALLPAMTGLLFFHTGYLFGSLNTPPKKKLYLWWGCAIIAVVTSHFYGPIEMYCCHYPNFIVSVLGAIGGTFIIMRLCNLFYRLSPKTALKTAQLGSISLLILIVHTIDCIYNLSPAITRKILFFIDDISPNIAERILFALIVSLILYQIPIVRRVLRLSKEPQYFDLKTSES